jgi:hypothetical protein
MRVAFVAADRMRMDKARGLGREITKGKREKRKKGKKGNGHFTLLST